MLKDDSASYRKIERFGWKDLTFGEDLPFTRFAPMVGRDLVAQLIEQVLHFCPSLTLSYLVACSQCRCSAVRSGALW